MATVNMSIAPTGLTSIIIPCCGMLEYTKLCVPSILRNTPDNFELIFLDIGSLDGTAEYLAGLRDGVAHKLRVEICRAATDLDIKNVCQAALDKAHGNYVCLLNNDTVVTPHWLGMMMALAQMSDGHGMVGPMSNYAAEEQRVTEPIPYRVGPRKGARPGDPLVDVQAVDNFAKQLHDKYRGKWIGVERLQGFCLLIRRAVLDKVGSRLREWTDLSLFDTDILSSKAREVGFTLARASDIFIHHFGARTFAHGAPTPAAVSSNGERR